EGQETLPTSQKGAVRVRVLSPKTEFLGQAKTSEEAVIALEISPEPGIDWRGVLAAHVEKAVDSKGREIKQTRENTTPAEGAFNEWAGALRFNLNAANNAMWAVAGDLESAGNQPAQSSREVPIRLKLNERETTSLNELQGLIYAQVQTPQEPVIR